MGACSSSERRLNGDNLPLELYVDEGAAWMAGNQLLNRWRHAEVLTLQRLYRAARGPAQSSAHGLPYEKIEGLFGDKLPDDSKVLSRLGLLFDARRVGRVDFRDLCRGLALCTKGSHNEKLRWLFDVFSTHNPHVYYGLRRLEPPAEVVAFLANGGTEAEVRELAEKAAAKAAAGENGAEANGHDANGRARSEEESAEALHKAMANLHMHFLLATMRESEVNGLVTFLRSTVTPAALERLNGTRAFDALRELLASEPAQRDSRVSTPEAAAGNGRKAAPAAAEPEVSWLRFRDWGSTALPEDVLDEVLDAVFWLLPSKDDELLDVLRLMRDHPVREGDKLYLVRETWWHQWCVYVGVDMEALYGAYACPPLSNSFEGSFDGSLGSSVHSPQGRALWDAVLRDPGIAQRRGHQVRPAELDNSVLSHASDTGSWALRRDVQVASPAPSAHAASPTLQGPPASEDPTATERVVAVHRRVWEMLLGFYGGGPAFPRRVVRQGSKNGPRLAVDLYPRLLRVALLDGRKGNISFSPEESGGAEEPEEPAALVVSVEPEGLGKPKLARQGTGGSGLADLGGFAKAKLGRQSSNGSASADAGGLSKPRLGRQGTGGSGIAEAVTAVALMAGASGGATIAAPPEKKEKDVLAVKEYRLCHVSQFDTAESFLASLEEYISPEALAPPPPAHAPDPETPGLLPPGATPNVNAAAMKRRQRSLNLAWNWRSRSNLLAENGDGPGEAGAEANGASDSPDVATAGPEALPRPAPRAARPLTRLWVSVTSLPPVSPPLREERPSSRPMSASRGRHRALSGSEADLEYEGRERAQLLDPLGATSEPIFVMGNPPSVRGARAPPVPQWRRYEEILLEHGFDPRRTSFGDLKLRDGVEHVTLMVEIVPPPDPAPDVQTRWPRDAFVESPTFRLFKVGDEVDAMDYRGSWYPGTVSSVVTVDPPQAGDDEEPLPHPLDLVRLGTLLNAPSTEAVPPTAMCEPWGFASPPTSPAAPALSGPTYAIRVHYDAFPENWDEWYHPQSARLAPRGSASLVRNRSGSTRSLDYDVGPTRSLAVSPMESDQNGTKNTTRILTRTSTPGQPFAPGACGLLNLCNSCYMNAGLQCLSFTPLLRAYLLSGKYSGDINLDNPLGTSGKIVEDFAAVMKELWSQKYVCVNPAKFKKTLGRYKSQFAGQEQEDSQEFMAMILDALHEDCNRVLKKPYVPEGDDILDDDPADASALNPLQRSQRLPRLAEEAWRRHLARNQSTVVDLFQGQLKTRITCRHCSRAILKFEPFMFMSVPIPRSADRAFFTVLFRGPAETNGASAPPPPMLKVAVVVPKDASVHDLRESVARIVDHDPATLCVAELGSHRVGHTHYDGDQEPMLTVRLGDAETRVPLVGGMRLRKPKNRSPSNSTDREDVTPRLFDGTDYVLYSVPAPRLNPRYFQEDTAGGRPTVATPTAARRQEPAFPATFAAAGLGLRCDVRDYRGSWTSAYIMAEAAAARDPDSGRFIDPRDRSGSQGLPMERALHVHFDQFSAKWDEWIGAAEWDAGVVAPVHSHAPPLMGAFEITAMQRRPRRRGRLPESPPDPASNRSAGRSAAPRRFPLPATCEDEAQPVPGAEKEVFWEPFAWPLLFHVDPDTTVGECLEELYHRVAAFSPLPQDPTGRNLAPFLSDEEEASTKGDQAASAIPPLSRWPFRVSVVDRENPSRCARLCSSSKSPPARVYGGVDCHGCVIHGDSLLLDRPVNNVFVAGTALSIDWRSDDGRDGENVPSETHACFAEVEAFVRKKNEGVSLRMCLDAFTREEELGKDEMVFCGACQTHREAVVQTIMWRLPEVLILQLKRFQGTQTWRDKLNTLVTFPLNGLDVSKWVAEQAFEGGAEGEEGVPGCITKGHAVYDLFAVANHLGSLHRGHYTSFARSSPCSPDGVESLTSALDGQWLYLDDEYVHEAPAEKVVSSSAYVLFYRRRNLSSANMINMTV